jgi:hypothetical protein
VIDASDATKVPLDGAVDAPDTGPSSRTRTGLIGLWEFNETAGTTIGDTSGDTPAVTLTVTPPGIVTFSAGTMTPVGMDVISSGQARVHLNADVIGAHAVTLEAWVMTSPGGGNQGTVAAPVVIAGLCSSVYARNIALLQAGKRWVARVRTTIDVNGGPDLTSSTDITPGAMTHLVVVDDATQRILYVNGKADAVDPLPGPPLNWDSSYKMVLGNELAGGRQWTGTFALVAMYKQALTSAQVTTNYGAGPNGP